MDGRMNREEAIHRLIEIRRYAGLGAVESEALEKGIQALMHSEEVDRICARLIREQPDIVNDSRWIPVEEHFPEIGKRVLVTAYGRVCYAMMTSVDGNDGRPIFRLQDSLKEGVVCETVSHEPYSKGRIDAWMPLPEPYKREVE